MGFTFKTIGKHFTLLAECKGTSKTGEGVSISIIDNAGINLDTVRSKGMAACGDCSQRKAAPDRKHGGCYVYNRPGGGQGAIGGIVNALERADIKSIYQFIEQVVILSEVAGYLRIGKFGDPAADAWTASTLAIIIESLDENTNCIVTGYTHQWRKAKASPLRGLLMASTETNLDTATAIGHGWGAFQIIGRNEKPWLTQCPAQRAKKDKEDHVPTCKECGLCDGTPVTIQIQKH